VTATFAQARRRARFMPALGSFIAELAIPDDGPFEIRRTLPSPGHHTIWGDAGALLASVVAVRPVTG
jgi:hypothetical protein